MKNAAQLYLPQLNKTGIPTTRLYYIEDGKETYVEDYSYFTNNIYMSDELLQSLPTGRTLTDNL